LYEVGASLEGILEGIWGKRMMDFAPKLEGN
jgi:hypothetical protein